MVKVILYGRNHVGVVFEGKWDPKDPWPGILKRGDRYFRLGNVEPHTLNFIEDTLLDITEVSDV